MLSGVLADQMPRGRPIAMAIQQRADNSSIQDAGKRFVFLLRLPFRHQFIALREAANAQSVRIGRPATPAGIFGAYCSCSDCASNITRQATR